MRVLDREIASLLSLLGLDPRSRSRFGAIVQQDQAPDKLTLIRMKHRDRNRPSPNNGA